MTSDSDSKQNVTAGIWWGVKLEWVKPERVVVVVLVVLAVVS